MGYVLIYLGLNSHSGTDKLQTIFTYMFINIPFLFFVLYFVGQIPLILDIL